MNFKTVIASAAVAAMALTPSASFAQTLGAQLNGEVARSCAIDGDYIYTFGANEVDVPAGVADTGNGNANVATGVEVEGSQGTTWSLSELTSVGTGLADTTGGSGFIGSSLEYRLFDVNDGYLYPGTSITNASNSGSTEVTLRRARLATDDGGAFQGGDTYRVEATLTCVVPQS